MRVVSSLQNVVFCTRVAWVCLVRLCVIKGRRLFSSVFAITERRDMGLYGVPLSVSLLGFGMGTMLANFHVWYSVGVKGSFNMLVRNASPRGPMCLKCLMFSMSGPCELLL